MCAPMLMPRKRTLTGIVHPQTERAEIPDQVFSVRSLHRNLTLKGRDKVSGMDPLSDEQLKALARKSVNGRISKNEAFELNKRIKLGGSLARTLENIIDGKE